VRQQCDDASSVDGQLGNGAASPRPRQIRTFAATLAPSLTQAVAHESGPGLVWRAPWRMVEPRPVWRAPWRVVFDLRVRTKGEDGVWGNLGKPGGEGEGYPWFPPADRQTAPRQGRTPPARASFCATRPGENTPVLVIEVSMTFRRPRRSRVLSVRPARRGPS
jgi:hypothetical protein